MKNGFYLVLWNFNLMVLLLFLVFESGKKICELILGSLFFLEKILIYFVKIFEDKIKL